jgi:hypothetical protein
LTDEARLRAKAVGEGGFELKPRSVSERRVQLVLVVDIRDEAVDAATGIAMALSRSRPVNAALVNWLP